MDAADSCTACGAPMASDQRYCLECGNCRSQLGSGLLDRLRARGSNASASTSTDAAFSSGPVPAGGRSSGAVPPREVSAAAALGDNPAQPLAAASAAPPMSSARSGGPTAVIAGVGVLLLSMGIGVLIGRSGSPSGKAATAPAQVISVSSPGTGGAGAATTPPTATTPTPSKSPTHKGASTSTTPSGAGSSPSKPAPPTVLNNLRTGGSGQSYEQKSKNLPNVVSTG